MPAATARVLLRNFESDALFLKFANFSIRYLHQSNRTGLKYAQRFFPEAVFDESLLEVPYEVIPRIERDLSGFGAIPCQIEDLLLLLRLYKPGDLAFIGLQIQTPKVESARQYPHRVISNLVDVSTRQFTFNQSDIQPWERFAGVLKSVPSWNSKWFEVSRRFFLYGGGKEFNPNFESEVDRVIDYAASLEAVLVPESDFIARRLRERAARLLAVGTSAESEIKRLLSKIYSIRSTLVHGSLLQPKQLVFLKTRDEWLTFEQVVRKVIVKAVKEVPAEEAARRVFLGTLYDVPDSARVEKLKEDFIAIKDPTARRDLLNVLSKE